MEIAGKYRGKKKKKRLMNETETEYSVSAPAY